MGEVPGTEAGQVSGLRSRADKVKGCRKERKRKRKRSGRRAGRCAQDGKRSLLHKKSFITLSFFFCCSNLWGQFRNLAHELLNTSGYWQNQCNLYAIYFNIGNKIICETYKTPKTKPETLIFLDLTFNCKIQEWLLRCCCCRMSRTGDLDLKVLKLYNPVTHDSVQIL